MLDCRSSPCDRKFIVYFRSVVPNNHTSMSDWVSTVHPFSYMEDYITPFWRAELQTMCTAVNPIVAKVGSQHAQPPRPRWIPRQRIDAPVFMYVNIASHFNVPKNEPVMSTKIFVSVITITIIPTKIILKAEGFHASLETHV